MENDYSSLDWSLLLFESSKRLDEPDSTEPIIQDILESYRKAQGLQVPQFNGCHPTSLESHAYPANTVSSSVEPPAPQLLPDPASKKQRAKMHKKFVCPPCNKWFTLSGHLKRHYTTIRHKKCVQRSEGDNPAEMAVSPENLPVDDNQYLPDFAALMGDSPNPAGGAVRSPKTPEVSSSSDIGLKCGDCNKTFTKTCYLTQHNQAAHSGEKPFTCLTCGKRFAEELIYLRHILKHVNDDKPHKCSLCPKQFYHKPDLNRHMSNHRNDKPFTCKYCDKGFVRKDHMLKHTKTHTKHL